MQAISVYADIDGFKGSSLIEPTSSNILDKWILARLNETIAKATASADDYKIRIDNTKSKAGMTITGDHPLYKLSFWSIRSVIAVEPFVELSIEPGAESTWKYNYEYYTR